jgi:PAS domain S-box-containing protein
MNPPHTPNDFPSLERAGRNSSHGGLPVLIDDRVFGGKLIGAEGDGVSGGGAHQLLNFSLDLLCVTDFEGRMEQVNPAWTDCLGWTAAELTGSPMNHFIHPDDLVPTIRTRAGILAGNPIRGFENRYRCRDGSYRWLSWNAHPLPGDRKVFAVARDITKRKEAELSIRRLNRLYAVSSGINEAILRIRETRELYEQACRIAVEKGGLVMAWVGLAAPGEDVLKPVTHWGRNEGYLELIEITTNPTRINGRGPGGLAFRTGRPAVSNDLQIEGGAFAFRQEALSRGYRSCAAFPLKLNGECVGILAVYGAASGDFGDEEVQVLNALAENLSFAVEAHQREDDRLRAEEELRSSEATMAAAQRIGHFGSWQMKFADPCNLTADGLRWSDELYRIAGLAPGSIPLTSEVIFDLIHPDDRKPVREAFVTAIRERRQYSLIHRIIRPSGEERIVHAAARITFDPETGRPVKMVGNTHDITEQKRAEQTLRESEQRFRQQATLLDKARDAILVRDLDHRIVYWNCGAERLYGWSAEEATGRAIQDLISQDPGLFLTATNATLENGEWLGETPQFTRAGKPIIVESHWTLVRDEEGNPHSFLSINTNITERKELEQQFLRAQRIESLGTLAGGIAHDLNNVLAPILMSIDLLKMQITAPRSLEILALIESSARRGAEMVSQVLSFACGMDTRRTYVDLRRLVSDLAKVAQETFPKGIRLETELGSDLWALEADPSQLHQVLLNLCVNARDAMPDGGCIIIRVANQMLDEDAAKTHGLRPGHHVSIEVEDNGSGIPATLVGCIFDPFFTTKDPGKGTGLGLSTTMAIVKAHGGSIQVDSSEGIGTRFLIYLPASGLSHADPAAYHAHDLPCGNQETILVVDDDLSIRQVTSKTLEAFGYRALAASNGAEAVSLYIEHADRIAVVLTDMMMPSMDGPALVRILKHLAPEVRIIGASGIASGGLVAQSMRLGVKHFLPKPYQAEMLLRTLKAVLAKS